MASEAEKIIPEVKQEEKKPVFIPKNLKKEFEATYTIPELVEAAAKFGTTTLVVRAALAKAGKESYTMKEAKNLIETLKNKEVKRNGI